MGPELRHYRLGSDSSLKISEVQPKSRISGDSLQKEEKSRKCPNQRPGAQYLLL